MERTGAQIIWEVLTPYISGSNVMSCPFLPGTHYIYGPVDTAPKCSYSRDHCYGGGDD